MDDELDRLVIGVRADTGAFSGDVAAMRQTLQSSLGDAATIAGGRIETALAKAIASGKLGFDDLKKTALSVFDAIEVQAIKSGLSAALGGSASGSGSTGGLVVLASALLGTPGRASGGPVSAGRAYTVGENGPEVFVPSSTGAIQPATAASPGRDVRVAITINAGAGDAAGALQRSGKQVARAVAQALNRAAG